MALFTVFVRGLTALFKVDNTKWRAVLVSALNPSVSTLNANQMICPHYPVVGFPASLLSDADRSTADFISRPHVHGTSFPMDVLCAQFVRSNHGF